MVTEWCARGSLYDVLRKAYANPKLRGALEWQRRLSMALDAAKVRTALFQTSYHSQGCFE